MIKHRRKNAGFASRKMVWLVMVLLPPLLPGCSPTEPNELDKLGKIKITIKNQAFELWIADESPEQDRGLMFITAEQMATLPDGTERGMIFVFPSEAHRSFWMKNTIIPLDIAYVKTAGQVASIHTMAALDTRTGQYRSGTPVRFAIEVNADVFGRIGLKPGESIQIPDSALKRKP